MVLILIQHDQQTRKPAKTLYVCTFMGLLRSAQLIGHNYIQSVKAQSSINGLGVRFLKDIYLYYFLTLLWSEPILNLAHTLLNPLKIFLW